MEQIPIDQYEFDKIRFSELLSNFTGISKIKIYNYISKNSISNVFEHSTSLDINNSQLSRINDLKEMHGLYNNLKDFDVEYKLNSTTKAGKYFTNYFDGIKDKECFACCFLDSNCNVISTRIISTGTVNEAPVYPREIAKLALFHDASSVFLSHNHPGGSLQPSMPDKLVTNKIADALSSLSISILDHIIVANGKYASFAELGLNLNAEDKVSEKPIKHSIKESIINIYSNKYPAIKNISESTAKLIHEFNADGVLQLKRLRISILRLVRGMS